MDTLLLLYFKYFAELDGTIWFVLTAILYSIHHYFINDYIILFSVLELVSSPKYEEIVPLHLKEIWHIVFKSDKSYSYKV